MLRKMIIVLVVLIPVAGYSHPGRTDANGGHYNRKTGEYHYHSGGGSKRLSYRSSGKRSYMHKSYKRRR